MNDEWPGPACWQDVDRGPGSRGLRACPRSSVRIWAHSTSSAESISPVKRETKYSLFTGSFSGRW